ncbi:MAG: phage tail protein [Endomicrobium sp.]|jgi:hypothetical protein|nr:phage tail protein [Endomicrobium sp.]
MKFYLYENLLSERFKEKNIDGAEKLTYAQIFERLKLEGYFVVIENDIVKKYPACANEKPQQEAIIAIKRIPKGDANTVSYILGGVLVAAGVVLSIVGYGVGVPLIIAGAGMIAGTAIAQIYAGDNVPDQKDAPQGKEQYGLQGARNRIALGSKYPVIFGTHVITPPLVGTYYTELSDNNGRGDQYLYGLLCIGYGQLSLKDIKLGLNPLASNTADIRNGNITIDGNYAGQLEIRQDGEYPTLYPYKMYEEQINAELFKPGGVLPELNGIESRFTPKKTLKITSIIVMNGLYKMKDNGSLEAVSVTVGMGYRKRGATGWSTIPEKILRWATPDTLRFELSYTFTQTEILDNPDGDWEVALYRTTVPSEVVKVRDAVYWGTLRSNINDRPVSENELKKMCLLAFRIKATETSNGVLDQLNCISTSVLPIYDESGTGESAWIVSDKTSNPAAIFLGCLRGSYLPEKVDVESIDWPAVEALYMWCKNNDYRCDGVISNGETLRNILNKVLATCRGAFYVKSGLYSLIHDIEKPNPIAILTPKNSRDFSANKSFAKLPKALEITYNDERNDYVAKNDLVLLDGETLDQNNGDVSEKLSVWGVTNYDQIVKLGRYMLAAARNRPEKYNVTVSIEHFGLPVGERVLFQHDVLLVGLAGGFVKAVYIDDNTIQLDEVLSLDAQKQYAIQIFKENDGNIIYLPVINVSGGITDILEVAGDLSEVVAQDIYAFGEAGKETLDCIIEAKFVNPSPELSAEISLASYAPEIFDAPSKPIPPYDPKTTVKGNYSLVVVPESEAGEKPNNGNTVQDDGGVYFDFQDFAIKGNTLLNLGSLKEVADAIFSSISIEPDINGNYAVGTANSSIVFDVDTLLFQNSSMVFWIKDITASGIVVSYVDDSQLNSYIISYDNGILHVQIQNLGADIPLDVDEGCMISIINDFDNSAVRVYKNLELIGNYELIANLISEDGDNLISEDDDNLISEGLIGYGNPIRGVPFHLFGNEMAGSSFSGKIAFFRIYGWALSEVDIKALYEDNRILLNTAAETRYLGEFEEAPLDINLYDVFTYTGVTNDTFLNGKNYALVQGGWQIWELKYGR